MTDSTAHTLPAALLAKLQAFGSSLAPEEAAQLQRLVLATATPGAVPGDPSATIPAVPALAAPGTADLPGALVDKLRRLADSLSPDERSALQAARQAGADAVQGYTLVELLVTISVIAILIPPQTTPTGGVLPSASTSWPAQSGRRGTGL